MRKTKRVAIWPVRKSRDIEKWPFINPPIQFVNEFNYYGCYSNKWERCEISETVTRTIQRGIFFFPILNNLIKRTLFHCNSNSKYNLQYLQWFLIVYWLMIRKFWTRCRKKLFTWFVVVFKFCYCLLVRFLFVWFFVLFICVYVKELEGVKSLFVK